MLVPQDRLSELTKAVFSVEQPQVYEAYSEHDAELRSFANAEQLDAFVSSRRDGQVFFDFAIWYPSCGGRAQKERIALKPEKCNGHSFRYTITGWGIFHLQCDFRSEPAVECRIAVNSHARALKWESTYPEWLPVQQWNWANIEKHERRLLRKLRSLRSTEN